MRKVEDAVTPAFSIEYDGALLVLCSNCRQIDCSHGCMGKQCPHRKSNIIGSLQNVLEAYNRHCVRSTPFDDLSEPSVEKLLYAHDKSVELGALEERRQAQTPVN